jgi:N-acetylglucosamine-6-phosphate deacetylase
LDVFPGLVDIHCHGAVGYDAFSPDHLEEMSIYFAKNGVTTWYPTTGGSKETILGMLRQPLEGMRGANMPGYHLEGPYLSPNCLGACDPDSIKLPDIHDFEGYDSVKLITIAPELDGAMEYIRQTDARVAIGHTTADYETAIAAIEAGASCLTHTFNAMPPLHHREPGVIGAAIDKDIYVQVICDGVHLHRSVVTALYRIFGRKMILISDAVCGTGLPNGEYLKQGKHLRIIKDGVIRTANGNLAGSAANLYMDVKKAIEFGIPREEAFALASTSPAEYMGLNKGKIETGYDADFLVVDDNNDLQMTVIGGKIFEE